MRGLEILGGRQQRDGDGEEGSQRDHPALGLPVAAAGHGEPQGGEQRQQRQCDEDVHSPYFLEAMNCTQSRGVPGMVANRPQTSAAATVASGGSSSISGDSRPPGPTERMRSSLGSSNQAVRTMGRKYAAFRMLLPASTSSTQSCPTSRPPSPRYHLLTNPAMGGMPIMPNAASVNAAVVQGMRRPMPASSLTWCSPADSA